MSSDSADPFYWMRVILASNRGVCCFSFASILVHRLIFLLNICISSMSGLVINHRK